MSARVTASSGDVEARRGACAIRSAANRGTTTPATSAARQKVRDGGNWVHRLLSKLGRVITVCIISDRFRRSPITSPETEANQGRRRAANRWFLRPPPRRVLRLGPPL